MSNDALFRLAHAAGIAPQWIDAFGVQQTVSEPTLHAILRALNLDCDNDADCESGITRLAEEEIRLALPPLITAQVDRAIVFSPQAQVHGLAYHVALEDGGEISGEVSSDPQQAASIPPINQIGYHHLSIGEHSITLAVAPSRCFSVADAVAHGDGSRSPHLWALAAQLYSLRRDDDNGIGDFSALQILARSAAAHGASAIAISPVHAMFSANPYHYSPYAPSSRLFFNAMHIDPAAVSGAAKLEAAIDKLGLGEERSRLRACELIDWAAAARWQLRVLRELYDCYEHDSEGWQEFTRFRHDGGSALEDHARFEALHAAMRSDGIDGDWRSWPPQYRNPRSEAVVAFATEHANEVSFHAFLQWQAARGLQQAQQSARDAGMAIGLISDLAVGAEGGGSQAWSRQNEMLEGLSVGAPPDLLGPRGQNWGLSAFSPIALRQHGYQAYIEMLRAAFCHAGGVRIDHILGLTRMWLVPNHASGAEGAYLRYPFEDLIRLIALESHRYRAIVIGEDLGTVPYGFSDTLGDAGLMGIRVLWFERHSNGFRAPEQWSDRAIATTSTHDLPTVLGWWRGSDIAWREKLDLMAPGADARQEFAERADERRALTHALNQHAMGHDGDRHAADPIDADTPIAPLTEILQFVGSTPAPLVIVPLEDALAQTEQPNLPNTIDSHPNWRRRLPEKAETMLDRASTSARLAALQNARAHAEARTKTEATQLNEDSE